MSWRDKQGFTLVEMIIAMSIMAIVGIAVAMLMRYGTRSYSFAKSELDLQMESQTLMAQMTTMIQEANYAEYDSANNCLLLYQTEVQHVPVPTGAPVGSSPTITKNVKDMKLIKFDDTKNNLYLGQHDHNVLKPASGGALTYADDELFAEYVETFQAAVDGNKVTVTLGMKSGSRTYSVDVTTKIRNKVVAPPASGAAIS